MSDCIHKFKELKPLTQFCCSGKFKFFFTIKPLTVQNLDFMTTPKTYNAGLLKYNAILMKNLEFVYIEPETDVYV